MSTAAPATVPKTQQPPRARSSTFVLVGLTIFGLTMFLVSAGLVFYLVYGRGASVADGSYLSFKVTPQMTDAPVSGALVLDPSAAPVLLTDATRAIRKAKDDDRIDGLYLDIEGLGVGFGGVKELRSALEEFRASGKPCVAYAEQYTTGTYYLASACDRVVMAPSGVGLVTGLASSITYYATLFEKIGVKAEMMHVGDFKSAVEPYERTGPSESASEAMNLLLDSLWSQMVAGIAAGRSRSPEEVQAWIDAPALSPQIMLERGMVDALAFRDQLKVALIREGGPKVSEEGWVSSLQSPEGAGDTEKESLKDEEISEKFTALSEYIAEQKPSSSWGSTKIAIVHAEGPIVSGESEGGLFGEQMLADRTFASWMRSVREDDEVKAVVLRVNSPGGSGQASDMMWREIERVKASGKPVVVSMGDYAASGGYFISAPADWIVAQSTTITGSIGVFGGKLNLGGTYEKLGLTEYTYKRGAESDLLSTTHSFSDGGRVAYQGFLDHFYEVFLGKVSSGRKMSRDEVHAIAQGRVWTGEQALERKLVDELGGLEQAIAKALELAKIEDKPENYVLVRYPAQKTFFELVMEDLDGSASVGASDLGDTARLLASPARTQAIDELLLLERVLGAGDTAAILPGAMHIE